MSKYILKKDLPFAKAGDEINLTNEMLDHNCVSVKGNDGMMWEIGFYEDVNQLISEGWIEEVKEVPLEQIKDLVEKYPGEVQKEVMKHASRQMKEWYDLTKNEPKKPDEYEHIINIPKVIENINYLARSDGKLPESCKLSPALYKLFLKQIDHKREKEQQVYTYGGIKVIKDSDEIFMSFTYIELKKEPKSDKKPGEFYIVSSPGKPNYAFVHYGQAFCEKCLIGGSDAVIIKVREVME